MTTIHPIHPFPARMAPEIALEECASLPPGSVILDPMVGSGVVVRVASERGHRGVGFDMDPLAVLMARVWTTPIDTVALREAAMHLVEGAERLEPEELALPWIDEDAETRDFVAYWFGKEQQRDLRRLSKLLHDCRGPIGDALRIALSRIIVTKDRGASLARDVSHSRPHRVCDSHDFPVMKEFLRSVSRLAGRLQDQPPPGNVEVQVGDARSLSSVASASVDAVITSPPYLNAIDYLRGHRMTLVWFGYRLGELRTIRADSIGAERAPDPGMDIALARDLRASVESTDRLPPRERRMIERYVLDLFATITELYRVLRPGGKAVLVVGNSCIRGVFVENARAVAAIATRVGFRLLSRHERELPAARRYLPPPVGVPSGPSRSVEVDASPYGAVPGETLSLGRTPRGRAAPSPPAGGAQAGSSRLGVPLRAGAQRSSLQKRIRTESVLAFVRP